MVGSVLPVVLRTLHGVEMRNSGMNCNLIIPTYLRVEFSPLHHERDIYIYTPYLEVSVWVCTMYVRSIYHVMDSLKFTGYRGRHISIRIWIHTYIHARGITEYVLGRCIIDT